MITRANILALALAVVALFLVGCGRPRPTAAPAPAVVSTAPAVPVARETPSLESLPADAWFSIYAVGKSSPTSADIVVVNADGQAIYFSSQGQQFQKQLDETTRQNWQRMFTVQAHFMTLQNDYRATTPGPDDNVHYTIRYRQDGAVKTVQAQLSSSPPELQTILRQFWVLADDMQYTS